MRSLSLVVSLSALALAGYWALTSGWAPEASSTLEAPAAPPSAVRAEAPPAARPPASPPAPTPAPPPVRTSEAVVLDLTTDTYVVEGGAPDELLRSLVARGPSVGGDRFFGLTEASVDLRYDLVEIPGACQIEGTQVLLSLQITLPEWRPPAGADPELTRAWGRFRRALVRHEDQHRAIAEAGARALHRSVDRLRRPTCDEVTEVAGRRLQRLDGEIAAAHRRYDAETGHGRTEGAVWPQR